ncbi:phosphoenolpyruvate synthase [Rhabdothermincola salaria]|uniref:phosphoenolpyruvate synthase n=1 Tax=Rhabdothermincola salaria TaxID=2903142 RepID=UPI001E4934B9|nr:phosphoenolpyruvate synthase [Rhabdothermincola salaria]MCD9624354.1 phosphoenolpyruvate synthase [Rhabdothermincola salaria]
MAETRLVVDLAEVTSADTALVGGKNASLGEMITNLSAEGISVPGGFATTADAYWSFLDGSDLRQVVVDQIDRLHGGAELADVGRTIRDAVLAAELPAAVRDAIAEAYAELSRDAGTDDVDVAVRSSATAEDLPEASFAGQQDSFLNVRGLDALLDACRRCYASLFNDRAINYREDQSFDHRKVALSIGVQRMVRSDQAGAGVMFTIDTETGFADVVVINAAWGLGEAVVSGLVSPDEYVVFKPFLGDTSLRPIVHARVGEKDHKIVYRADGATGDDPTTTEETTDAERRARVLTDDEILTLARWAVRIEEHYGAAMDIEWAKDGRTGEIAIVQARPETVQARRQASNLRRYRLTETGERLVTGLAIGDAIASGPVCRLSSADDIDRFVDGAVLVTTITDPDWEPVMKRAAAIVTDHGGRTSHAAIVSRELGVAAVIGTGDATSVLTDGQEVTVSCAEGDEGVVLEGLLGFETEDIDLDEVADTRTAVMLNLAAPAGAMRWWRLPADGVGLTRMEFIVANEVKVHPMALVHFDDLDDADRDTVAELTRGYEDDRGEYFVERLAHGVGRIAVSRWPDPVIVRLSDFKTNEYARLLGGKGFEPHEANPMIGWRGASRYYSDGYREGFALECRGLRRVRDEMGLTNVVVMVPFCRTLGEADRVLEEMAAHGLERGVNGLEVFVMAEIPSNIVLASEFADRFDGFSIGSNDLTQLTLGVDRDSSVLAPLFDETDPAVTRSIEVLIERAHAKGRKVGLCGQRPSDDPEFAAFLVRAGIDSISVTPDSFLRVKQHVLDAEHQG